MKTVMMSSMSVKPRHARTSLMALRHAPPPIGGGACLSAMRDVRAWRGFTLIELIITVFIVSILVGVAVPLARNSIKRQKEVALRERSEERRVGKEGRSR